MLWQTFLLLIGLALIIKGGDLFVTASVRIAELLRLPRIVIGSTLVSLATTSPEMVVSIMSGLKGEPGLAVGNAIGSCICNIGLILGTMAVLKHIDVHPPALRVALWSMFGAGALVFLMTLDLQLSRLQGLVLLALGIAYFIFDFIRHERHPKPGETAEARIIEQEMVSRYSWLHTKWGTGIQFGAGAVMVVFGSRLLVDSAVAIAESIGIPSIVIGLTVVAVGTSLPELVTAITSSRQNVSDLAVGNILGANIANLTLIVGTAGALSEMTMARATQLFNFPALLIAMLLLLYAILSEKRVTRKEGVGLLTFYGLYIAGVVLIAVLVLKS